ncbi:MAG: hypothetical protein NUV50_05325 [Rhodospirillales bacterium]|nr:hypothetical protein [Rhodospirillales bacterium]
MEISASSTAAYAARAQASQRLDQTRATAQVSRNDGADREPDNDADDRAKVTPTRGQNVNIVA